MENTKHALHFFLGANTPQGFVSRFDQLGEATDGWRKFVIKGGPGTGKSRLMKQVAQEFSENGAQVELIHCSSDIDSLDGVILHEVKAVVADGTAPHLIEPKYPGAYESMVFLNDCWDEEGLQANRARIMDLNTQTALCHERCCRFLAAAGSLMKDTYRIAGDYVDPAKIARYAARISRKEFHTQKDCRGSESVRFLSAVTAQGVTTFEQTPRTLCSKIYVLEDEYGAVSRLFMNAIRANALQSGLNIIACYCVSSPFEKLEHVLIPSLGIAFLTSNRYHSFAFDCYRRIHARRFMDTEGLKSKKQRLSFNRRAVAELLGEASGLLAEAKTVHDELEACYTAQMDFAKVNAKGTELLEKLMKLRG